MNQFGDRVSFIWSVADLLRGPCEIPFTRHFYKYVPPRPLAEIEADIAGLEKNIIALLREVAG